MQIFLKISPFWPILPIKYFREDLLITSVNQKVKVTENTLQVGTLKIQHSLYPEYDLDLSYSPVGGNNCLYRGISEGHTTLCEFA